VRHFDHGYAVTSHSSQGLTENRVIVNIDTNAPAELLNPRFAYVSISRASEDTRIYTNDATTLGERLSTLVTKSSAVDFQQPGHSQPQTPKEYTIEQQNELKPEPKESQSPRLTAEQIEHARHYGPLETTLRSEATGYEWKHECAGIQSYQHNKTGGWLHIDRQGQFFNRQAQPVAKEIALEHARHSHSHSVEENAQSLTSGGRNINTFGLSL